MEIKSFPVPQSETKPDQKEKGNAPEPKNNRQSQNNESVGDHARRLIRSASTACLNRPTVLQSILFVVILSSLISATIVYPYAALITSPIIALVAGHCVACAVAILLALSNGEQRLDYWPSMSPNTSFINSLWLFWIVVVAGAVPFLFSTIVFRPGWLCFLITTVGTLLILPVVAVSMLRSASMSVPLSKDVLKSIDAHQRLWIAFWVVSLTLAFLVVCPPIISALCDLPSAVTTSAAVFSTVPGLFVFCAVLGAFAQRIDVVLDQE